MRQSESSEIAGRDHALRPATLQEELLRLPAVIRRVGLQKTAIYEKIRRAEFPKPVAIGVRARAWRSSDIDNWIAERSPQSALVQHLG
jgi:prophage regulatory protein